MVPPDMDTETVAKPVMENGYEDEHDDDKPIVFKRRSSVASSSNQSKSNPRKLALVRKEIQDETDRITGKSKQISPVPIHLSIFSPNGAIEGQPETIVKDTESMVRTYVDKPNSIILDTSREFRHRWTLPEEQVLLSAWLNTRNDDVVGNEQKGGTFWDRVATYYAASPSVSNLPIRESNTCKQKWAKINKSVSKFAGYYDYASRQHHSGKTEDDVMELAYKLYFQDQKVKFTLEHAWRLLKNDQKWCAFVSLKSSQTTKKSKRPEGVYSPSSNTGCQVEEGTTERPMGVKAAKAKGKKKRKLTTEDSEGSSVRELEDLWVIKDKDLVIKERLSKKKLLNSLIAKSGPLSEIEETLKNKLITEML